MNFEYDSWNRIQNMTYPDGEVVSYFYNSGGDLESVTGFKRSTNHNVLDQNFQYINNIHYDKFGNRTFIQYGNGTEVNYSYDILQRLSNMTSYGRSQANGALALMQDLSYRYDNVGNIKEVGNNAFPMNNGLGGRYVNSYEYDELYRLTKSTGYNRDILLYSLDMEYSDNGKITRKKSNSSSNGVPGFSSYIYNYRYNTTNNQLNNLNVGLIFEWDGNGNLLGYETRPEPEPEPGFLNPSAMVYIFRKHCWNEENQMHGFFANRTFGYYLYDGSGERVYKMNGSVSQVNVNGKWFSQPKAEGITLYASPYLVATHTGYTKHYYAGEERIASKIGGGGLAKIGECLSDNFVRKSERAQKRYDRTWDCLGTLTPEIPDNNFTPDDLHASARQLPLNLEILPRSYYRDRTLETQSYFYHPDHLGSSSWITDVNGVAIQHLQYLPFGELRVNQRSTTWNSRYTFSAKEKDEESGYGYFGARYYSSDLSIWLSVDPLASKYPGLSPYVYCANNPVILVDPDGMDIWTIYEDGSINREKNTKIDRIDVIDKDGNITKGTEAKYGTIKQHTLKGEKTTIDYFEIKGDNLAKETFENIANTDTKIEWTHAKVGTENSGKNIVGTSHQEGGTTVGSFLRETGYTLKEVNHNHPSGIPLPSGQKKGSVDGDIPSAALYKNTTKLNIYVNGKGGFQKGYYPYDKNGIKWGVVVTPK